MNTSAIILMSLVWVSVISLTVYFFIKILKNPKHAEPDVYGEHEDSVD
jgi:heme/copper-type cytochrome/quinol oxidase subunit 2